MNNNDSLILNKSGVKGKVLNFTGESGEHWISIIPSLDVSGYGNSEFNAIQDLKYNLDIFFKDLFNLSENRRDIELKKWAGIKIKFSKRNIHQFMLMKMVF